MLALLLQAASLFPAAPTPPEADAAFRARVEALAAQEEWELEDVDALRAEADQEAEWAALAALLREGDAAQVRLTALLAAGLDTSQESGRDWLRDALFEVGCTHADEAIALACLLAPQSVPQEWWPALLMRAQDPLAELPVRAAAMARLLDGGCPAVWPLVRSVLRTGTAMDEPAPWADWKRGGRYELPKRLLVLSLDRSFKQRGEEPCGFEPNAAWSAQVEQLATLEPRMWRNGRSVETPLAPTEAGSQTFKGLLEPAARGDRRALRALGMLEVPIRPGRHLPDADLARRARALRPR